MTPETLARQYVGAEHRTAPSGWRDRPGAIHAAMKDCADRRDRDGQAFWCAVYSHYLTFESHLVTTGAFPSVERPSIAQYVAMSFWDDGCRGPEDAILSALYREDLEALAFFREFLAHYQRLTI